MEPRPLRSATYFLETFGCQMNVLDSQLVESQLRAAGMEPVADHRRADVILFNTCSVRQHAEDKVLSRLGQLRPLKLSRPEVIIGVMGCMAERIREELFITAPHVDLLCGPGELYQLPALIQAAREHHKQVAALARDLSRRTQVVQRAREDDPLEALDLSRTPDIEASVLQSYIRVQRGCDKFCTYCVVPFVRGPERSRPPGNIVQEARLLASYGCREITLLGQTVNSYMYPEDGRRVTLARLLERVHAVDGIDRIRFVTSYPAGFDEDIFRVMRDYPRVMPYLHIPAQSGSDRVLKAMRREYTRPSYLKLMETARQYVPHIALAGDFIVGFSGETAEEFSQTVDLVRAVEYEGLFIFKYSPRPGTRADRNLPDDVPHEVKARRNNELLAVQNEISLRHKQALVGQTVEVLVEGPSKAARKAHGETRSQLRARGKAAPRFSARKLHATPSKNRARSASERSIRARSASDGPERVAADTARAGSDHSTVQLVGRTPGDLMAIFAGRPEHIGALVKVHVESASPHTLFGRVVEVVSPPRPARIRWTGREDCGASSAATQP
jgi:tRNA-2-methylthio-N6-dimethylallyladenosine synthase